MSAQMEMTAELWILLDVGILYMVLWFLPGIAKLTSFQLLKTGNLSRDDLPPLSGWGGRAERAAHNLSESLFLFTILIFTVQLTGANNGMTLLGAQIFLAGRLLHPLFYITGLAYLRTLSMMVATGGMVLIGLQLT